MPVKSKAWRLTTAHANFLKGVSDSENGRQVGVSRQTIFKWKTQNDWESEKLALAETVKEKYISQESDRIVKDITTIDTDHREIVQSLRIKYREMAMSTEDVRLDKVTVLSALVELGGKMIRLEREVLGLDKIKGQAKPPQFPTSFLIQLETKQGPVLFDPINLSKDGIKDLEDILPNQNPSHYGDGPSTDDEEEEVNQILAHQAELPYSMTVLRGG